MPVRFLPIVDTYVTRSLLVIFGLCSIAVCMLVSIVDAFQRMDEFIRLGEVQQYGLLEMLYVIFTYYLCLTLQYFLQYMVPFISMIAGIIVVAQMCGHREFTALRASGVPLQRVLVPMAIAVLVIGMTIFLLRDNVLPHLARSAYKVNLAMKPRGGKPVTLILRDSHFVKTYMMGHFDPVRQVAHNFRLEIRDMKKWAQGATNEYEVYIAPEAKLSEGKWNFSNPQRYMQGRYGRDELPADNIDTRVTPAMLEQAALGPAVMTSRELRDLGEDVSMQVELAQRQSGTLAGVVLLVAGVSLVLRNERTNPGSASGRIKSVIMAIFLCAGYYVVQSAFVGFAESGSMGPTLSAWVPNFFFGAWGGYSFYKVNI